MALAWRGGGVPYSARGRAQEEKSLLGNVQFGGPAEKQSTLGRHVHKILAVRGNYLLPIFFAGRLPAASLLSSLHYLRIDKLSSRTIFR